MKRLLQLTVVLCLVLAPSAVSTQQAAQTSAMPDPAPLQQRKTMATENVDAMTKQIQVMVDSVFSFGELGFQEVETSKYLTGILEKDGFTIKRGIAGIPTAWTATWGSGKPVIAIGSDIDGIPQ